MSIDQHIDVTISVNNSGVSRIGFGTIGIVSYRPAPFGTGKSLTYTQLADAITAGFPADGPEALAMAAIMAQSPHPTSVKMLLGTNKPTQVYELDISTVKDSTTYAVNVKGEGVTATAASFASGVGATNDAIVAGLVAALNAVVGKNYLAAATGGAGAQVVTVTAAAPGDWFSLEVVDVTLLSAKQTHVDPGIAADIAAINTADSDWYYLETTFNSSAMVLAAAAAIEAMPFKVYTPDVSDTKAEQTAAGGGDTLDQLNGHTYKRTMGCYHRKPNEMFGPGVAGRLAPLTPGSWDAAYKEIAGCTVDNLTATQEANLDARNATYYKSEATRNITWEGKVGSADYGFFDVTVGLDAFLDDLQKSMFGVLVARNKVAYTDQDIAQLTAAGLGAIKRGIRNGIIAPGTPGSTTDPVPTLTFPSVASIDPSVRALRQLPDGACSFRYAGSVHKAFVNVAVTF